MLSLPQNCVSFGEGLWQNDTHSILKNLVIFDKSSLKLTIFVEQITMEEVALHKSCFKCAHGGCFLTPSSYASLDGIFYCNNHFSQLFMEKGTLSHVLEAAKTKSAAPSAVESEEEENKDDEPVPQVESEEAEKEEDQPEDKPEE